MSNRVYIAECCGLYVMDGGFTHDVAKAKRWETASAALRACGSVWTIRRVT